MSETVRLIKKYPNRRLYDTKTSTYITLADVKELVLKQETFKVVDAKSGADLTRSILLQIILDEEASGAPMFSSDVLTQFIRFYGSAMQGMVGSYLESNIQLFNEVQKRMQEQSQSMPGTNPGGIQDMWKQFMTFQGPAMENLVSTYMDQSRAMFSQMQEKLQHQTRSMFTGFPFPGFTPSQPGEKSQADGDKPEEKK